MHGPTTITSNIFDEAIAVQRLKGSAKIFKEISFVFASNDFSPQQLGEWPNISKPPKLFLVVIFTDI
jgi:hypothetical protein